MSATRFPSRFWTSTKAGVCALPSSKSWAFGNTTTRTFPTLESFAEADVEEVERYMRLLLSGADTTRERLHMLERRRNAALDEIHLKEKQLQRLDYLRYQMRGQKA